MDCVRSRQKPNRAFLGRTAVAVSVLAGIASIVTVALAVVPRDRDRVAEYQQLVLTSCADVHKILTKEHNETFTVDLSQMLKSPGMSPKDATRVNKDPLLSVLESNLASARIPFRELNTKPVPAALATQHAAAVTAQKEWYANFELLIETVRRDLPPNAPVSKLEKIGEKVGNSAANAKLNSAMSTLAGRTCQATD